MSISHTHAEVWGTQKTDFRAVRNLSSQRSSVDILQLKTCCPTLYRLCMLSLFWMFQLLKRLLEEKKKLFYHTVKGQVLRFSTLLSFPLPQENLQSLSYFFKQNSSFSALSTPKSCFVFRRQLCAWELLRVSNPGRLSDITLLLVC